jgi:UDP-N-acetylmuramyl pentapeptide synthase
MIFDAKSKIERYFRKNPQVKTIVITGSYGRKSAIRCIGMILGQALTVTMGVNKAADPDVVVLDYKSMSEFPEINPDIVVVTSCETDEEAREFFELANRAKHVVINYNDVPQQFAKYLRNPEITTYGDELPADFYFENSSFSLDGYEGDFIDEERDRLHVKIKILGEHNIRPIIMACAVGKQFQIPKEKLIAGTDSIVPLHGRMSPAKGIGGTIVIDDSAYVAADDVKLGCMTIMALESPAKTVIIDDVNKIKAINTELLTDICVLGSTTGTDPENPKIHYFEEEVDLIHYIGERAEEGGLILLEIPLPEIIESYIW